MGAIRYLVLLLLLLSSPALAEDFYVSQSGGATKAGTHDDPWSLTTLRTTGWGLMGAGDTLYVIDTIVFDQLVVSTSGEEDNYFTIAGHDENSGFSCSLTYPYTSFSETPDEYGAYSYTVAGTYEKACEYTTASGALTAKVLKLETKVPDETWTAGSFYSSGGVLYWKPFDGTIANKTFIRYTSSVYFNGLSWVKVDGLKNTAVTYTIGNTTTSTNIWLNDLEISNMHGNGVQCHETNNHYARVSYCNIHDGYGVGVYIYNQHDDTTALNSDYWTIDHNTITNMTTGDGHCIGVQGGVGHVIEHNTLSYCGTGITMWGGTNQLMSNNTIRYNHVSNMMTAWGNVSGGYGIGWEGVSVTPANRTGNVIAFNIVHDTETFGINSHFVSPDNWTVNNVVEGCSPNFKVSDNGNGVTQGGVVKNNISIAPTSYHIQYLWNNGDTTGIDIDNNLYNNDAGNLFSWQNVAHDFAGWKGHFVDYSVGGGDLNSYNADAKLTNAGGSYALATDFSLQSDSPAIGKGEYISAIHTAIDYAGVVWKNPPAVGAYERYLSSALTFGSGASVTVGAGGATWTLGN